ncbi:serine arginine-rich splicing factor [Rhizophlyctis rosea]|uniref:Serine arginine-rich splicing factor n=1 Tax=Rhizophlyctis rosea TaxID=64517 RepID=A0AAD5S7F4_9FUNG|nr:serine arginine-rich splicing factor [Rhizophlyctis rosea]
MSRPYHYNNSRTSTTRVFIGHLSNDASQRDVRKLFRRFGDIADIHLCNGFGFVEFYDYRDANDAIADLDGDMFFNQRISVELSHSKNRRNDYGLTFRTDHRLIVTNLSHDVSWQDRNLPVHSSSFWVIKDLKDHMRQAGEVTFANVGARGEGIVEFANEDGMKKALKTLDESDFGGRRIYLQKERKSSASHSRTPERSPRRRRRDSPDRSRRHRYDRDDRNSYDGYN